MSTSGQVTEERRYRRFIVAIVLSNFLLFIGASAILPLLPSFLRESGSNPGLVGIVMAAYFAASVLTQYPVGRLCDRIGARPVLFSGLVVFAIGSIGFALSSGPWIAIVCRGLQGIGSSAASIAEGAIIGTQVPHERQGRAYGAIYASQMFAFAVGPLLGSIAGLGSIRELFVAAGIAAVLAWLPMSRMVLQLPSVEKVALAPDEIEVESIDDIATKEGFISARIVSLLHRNQDITIFTPGLIGAIAFFTAGGFLGGAYESCWTLLLDARGATTFQIGLSWTLFALPYAALSVPAGRLAERVNRKRLAMISMLISAGFAVVYPFMHVVVLLVGLGTVEAMCAVFGGPSAMMIVSQSVGINDQGAAQGAVGTSRTAATAFAAAISGALFGVDPVVPFAFASGLALVALVVVHFSWRRS
ncbi:MAG TPA: MFS transporter [Acidimicrobiales bacterium]|nr:MFS transporter [Acidimicrobiales bacterium]